MMPFEVFDPERPTNMPPIIPMTEQLRTLCLKTIETEYENA
jgi:hypothetical protein